jgi:hypothetical protein
VPAEILDPQKKLASSRKNLKERKPTVSKPKLEWAEKGEAEDFDAAERFLSLLCSDTKAKAFATSLRDAKLVEHAAKDLLRAAHLPLLPSDESHVDGGPRLLLDTPAARRRTRDPR